MGINGEEQQNPLRGSEGREKFGGGKEGKEDRGGEGAGEGKGESGGEREERGASDKKEGRISSALHKFSSRKSEPGEQLWSYWSGCMNGDRYWLVRFLFLRLMGFVYLFAFLSLALQVLPLIGSDGLLPVGPYLEDAARYYGSSTSAFFRLPSIFWFVLSDPLLWTLAWLGVLLSLLLLFGFANVPLLLLLWILYLSFVNVGQVWYGYGWEVMLLETGFLSIFLVPLRDPRPFSKTPPPVPIIWALRWLTIRVFVGAGLIKLRGDACWDFDRLQCLDFHFETQPIPNPLSPLFHRLPDWALSFGVLWNHFVELLVPFYLFFGMIMRNLGAILLITFQGMLLLSGNLSFLNYLTIAISFSFFDDEFLKKILPSALVKKAEKAAEDAEPVTTGRKVITLMLILVVVVLSGPVVLNMISSGQMMNTSYDSLHLVNTYGAFGSVTEKRYELVVEGTREKRITNETDWKPYEFPAKPGDLSKSLPVVAPYQPRLAWQFWFAAMSEPRKEPWLMHLVWKLLNNDETVLSLVEKNPFHGTPPEYIRIRMFRYSFAGPESKQTWERDEVGIWFGPISRDNGWLKNAVKRRWGNGSD